MSKAKIIYCPKCGNAVTKYDGRSTMNLIADCRNCWKRIVYHIDSEETEMRDIPPRACSSGMTFY